MEARYKTDYTGEFVITATRWAGDRNRNGVSGLKILLLTNTYQTAISAIPTSPGFPVGVVFPTPPATDLLINDRL
jgi:hypothetical protein